jgi:hypothetical protein
MRRLIVAWIVVVAVVTVTSIPTAADARRGGGGWRAGGWPGPGVGLRRSHEGNPGGGTPY